jgi:hypothetical protein
MKKLFTVVAALCFVMSGFAEAITCAQALELAMQLPAGSTGTEDVTVHGFITSTDGVVSRKQQVFWMADTPDGGQVFEAYWANLPEPYASNNEALPVGTELNMTGKLMNYQDRIAEIKNGTLEIINVPVVVRDTFDVTADEAVLEASAWSVGEISTDIYRVSGKIKEVQEAYTENQDVPGFNGKSTFLLEVTNEEEIVFKAFRCYSVEEVFAGDSVIILGPLQLYAEKVVEVAGGKVTITKKDHKEAQIINATTDEAIEEALKHDVKWLSEDIYVVSGTVDSISYSYSAEKGTQSFYLATTSEVAKFCAYSCNVPSEIVVGDKVTVKGHLQLYAADLAEISNGEVTVESQGVENIFGGEKAIKTIEDGQVVIIRNGVRYNALGVEMK